MRYTLTINGPKPVTSIIVDGFRIVSPTDEQVDNAGAGYMLSAVPTPPYDPVTQNPPTFVWELEGTAITQVWTVTDKTQQEIEEEAKSNQRAQLTAQIAQTCADFETYKATPLTWTDGKGYLPKWVTEYYTPMLQVPAAFPYGVTAADGTTSMMSLEDFKALYTFLVASAGAETLRVNELLAGLTAQLAELEG